MGNGQWAMGNGQWAMGNGQWVMGNGQWAMDDEEVEVIPNPQFPILNSQLGIPNAQFPILSLLNRNFKLLTNGHL
jgi:hypothetical protein